MGKLITQENKDGWNNRRSSITEMVTRNSIEKISCVHKVYQFLKYSSYILWIEYNGHCMKRAIPPRKNFFQDIYLWKIALFYSINRHYLILVHIFMQNSDSWNSIIGHLCSTNYGSSGSSYEDEFDTDKKKKFQNVVMLVNYDCPIIYFIY